MNIVSLYGATCHVNALWLLPRLLLLLLMAFWFLLPTSKCNWLFTILQLWGFIGVWVCVYVCGTMGVDYSSHHYYYYYCTLQPYVLECVSAFPLTKPCCQFGNTTTAASDNLRQAALAGVESVVPTVLSSNLVAIQPKLCQWLGCGVCWLWTTTLWLNLPETFPQSISHMKLFHFHSVFHSRALFLQAHKLDSSIFSSCQLTFFPQNEAI